LTSHPERKDTPVNTSPSAPTFFRNLDIDSLIAHCLHHNEDAWAELQKRFQPRLEGFVRARLLRCQVRDWNEVETVVQQVWVAVAHPMGDRLGRYHRRRQVGKAAGDGGKRFLAFLLRLARSKTWDRVRLLRKRRRGETEARRPEAQPAGMGPGDYGRQVAAMAAELPEALKGILLLLIEGEWVPGLPAWTPAYRWKLQCLLRKWILGYLNEG
jgi:DNA-directed RNA polymerase specialized sigma24 family protein